MKFPAINNDKLEFIEITGECHSLSSKVRPGFTLCGIALSEVGLAECEIVPKTAKFCPTCGMPKCADCPNQASAGRLRD